MNNMRQPAIGILIFMIFIGLFSIIYSGFSEEYSFTTDEQMLNNSKTMTESLDDLDLIDGENGLRALAEDMIGIVTPSNPLDVLGALAASGIGIVKLLYNIVTYPVLILNVVNGFYRGAIPDPIMTFVEIIYILGLAFVILSVVLKRDV